MKRRIRREDGVALMMALMVMMTLSIVTVTAVTFTSSTTRHANRSKSDQQAYALAEAGLNNALSQLASHYPNTTTQYDSSWVSGSTGVALAGGTSTWSGSFASNKWTLTGTGTIKNPDSGVTRTKTLTSYVDVTSSTGLTGAYAYGFFMGDPNSCTTFENGAVVTTSIYIAGCLNLVGSAQIKEPNLLQHTIGIHVGKDLSLANSGTTVGTFVGAVPTWSIASANIVGTIAAPSGACIYASVRQACGTSSYVYSNTAITRNTSSVPMPSYNIDTVYAMASGKWKDAVCSTGTQPFETDYTRNGSAGSVRLIRWNAAGAGSAMPSFDCTVYSNGNTGTYVGRLKWTKGTAQTDSSLYIDGTVFLDGSFDALNIDGGSYTGNGTLYVDGKIHFDNASALCGPVSSGSAVLSSSGGCNSAWQPSLGELLLVSCNASASSGAACNSAGSWSMQMSGNSIVHYTGGALVTGEYYVTNSGTVVGPVWANYADLTGAAQITPFTSLPSGAPSSGSTGYSIGAPYNYH